MLERTITVNAQGKSSTFYSPCYRLERDMGQAQALECLCLKIISSTICTPVLMHYLTPQNILYENYLKLTWNPTVC